MVVLPMLLEMFLRLLSPRLQSISSWTYPPSVFLWVLEHPGTIITCVHNVPWRHSCILAPQTSMSSEVCALESDKYSFPCGSLYMLPKSSPLLPSEAAKRKVPDGTSWARAPKRSYASPPGSLEGKCIPNCFTVFRKWTCIDYLSEHAKCMKDPVKSPDVWRDMRW
jgi:hypothetical protein